MRSGRLRCPLLPSLAFLTALPASTPFSLLLSHFVLILHTFCLSFLTTETSLPSIWDDTECLFALGRRGEGKRVGGKQERGEGRVRGRRGEGRGGVPIDRKTFGRSALRSGRFPFPLLPSSPVCPPSLAFLSLCPHPYYLSLTCLTFVSTEGHAEDHSEGEVG